MYQLTNAQKYVAQVVIANETQRFFITNAKTTANKFIPGTTVMLNGAITKVTKSTPLIGEWCIKFTM